MNNSYIIRWKNKVNGRAGKGSKMFSLDEAERLAQELNEEYPDILHEVALTSAQPTAVEEHDQEREMAAAA